MDNMLTKNDLLQIREIIRSETRLIIREETPPIVEKIIEKKIQPLRLDISVLKLAIGKLQDDVTILRHDVQEIREDLNVITQVFDDRITRLENILTYPNAKIN